MSTQSIIILIAVKIMMSNQNKYDELILVLQQYLWFLGQDTLNPDDNLLQQYGFAKHPAVNHGGTSRYTFKWGDRTVELHSFCVGIYGNRQNGFLFVRAHDAAYLYLGNQAPLPGHYLDDLILHPENDGVMERFLPICSEFLEWLEDYEQWIDSTQGKGYRKNCYKMYHRKWCPACRGT